MAHNKKSTHQKEIFFFLFFKAGNTQGEKIRSSAKLNLSFKQ
jgi:hypothetical protein